MACGHDSRNHKLQKNIREFSGLIYPCRKFMDHMYAWLRVSLIGKFRNYLASNDSDHFGYYSFCVLCGMPRLRAKKCPLLRAENLKMLCSLSPQIRRDGYVNCIKMLTYRTRHCST